MRTDLSAFLPTAHSVPQELLVKQLQGGAATGYVLAVLHGDAPQRLAEGSRELAKRLHGSEHISMVANSPESVGKSERELLFRNRYLLNLSGRSIVFDAVGLRVILEDALKRLSSSLAMMERRYVAADPTGEWRYVIGQSQEEAGIQVRHGVWFSPSGKGALLVIRTKGAAFDLEAKSAALREVRDAFDFIRTGTLDLSLSGPSVFAVAAQEAIKTDVWRLSLIGNIAVIVLLAYAFRSGRVVAVSILPLLSGIVFGVAAVLVVDGYVHGITLAFGVTLTGVAIDYPIHLFGHAGPDEPPSGVIERIWPTLRLGVATTAISYGVMSLAGVEGLFQLGLLSGTGVLAAGAVTRWILPVLASNHREVIRTWGIPALSAAPARAVQTAAIGIIALCAVYLSFQGDKIWQSDLRKLSPVPRDLITADRSMREELGLEDPRTMVAILGNDLQEVLERCEDVMARGAEAVKAGTLQTIDGPCRYLPSVASQRQRQRQIPEAATLRKQLREASLGLPFQSGMFEPFVNELERTRGTAPLTLDDLKDSVIGARVEGFLSRKGEGWVAMLSLRGVRDQQVVSQVLKADNRTVFLLDLKHESEAMVGAVQTRAVLLAVLGVVVAFGALWIGLKSVREALGTLLPVGGAVTVVCALLVFMGDGISLFHLLSLLLVVGLGLDYFLFFRREGARAPERQFAVRTVTLCSATTIFVFGVLATSQIPVLSAIGTTVALGAALCLILAALFGTKRGHDVRMQDVT